MNRSFRVKLGAPERLSLLSLVQQVRAIGTAERVNWLSLHSRSQRRDDPQIAAQSPNDKSNTTIRGGNLINRRTRARTRGRSSAE